MLHLMDEKNKRPGSLPQNMSNSAFQQFKQKLTINREEKSSSQNSYSPTAVEINLFNNGPISMNPPMRIVGNMRDVKLQIRNGSFLKPKNYMYAVDKRSLLLKDRRN